MIASHRSVGRSGRSSRDFRIECTPGGRLIASGREAERYLAGLGTDAKARRWRNLTPSQNAPGGPGISLVNNTGITTAQIFPTISGVGNISYKGVVSSGIVFSSSAAVVLPVPGSGRYEGRYFCVTASGWLTLGGSSPNAAVTFYSGTSTTPGSDAIMKTSGAQSLSTGASYPWMGTMELEGDSQSGVIQGIAEFIIGNSLVARAALAGTFPTGLTFSNPPNPTPSAANVASEPVFSICVGITFGVANAANVAQLTQFVLEGA